MCGRVWAVGRLVWRVRRLGQLRSPFLGRSVFIVSSSHLVGNFMRARLSHLSLNSQRQKRPGTRCVLNNIHTTLKEAVCDSQDMEAA